MDTVTDYMGNEIKEGDSICLIKVLWKQRLRFMGFLVLGEGLQGEPEPILPDKPLWEKGEYMDVFYYCGKLAIVEEGGEYASTHFVSTIIAFMDKETTVLAIKGKSDTKAQYKKYLKENVI